MKTKVSSTHTKKDSQRRHNSCAAIQHKEEKVCKSEKSVNIDFKTSSLYTAFSIF